MLVLVEIKGRRKFEIMVLGKDFLTNSLILLFFSEFKLIKIDDVTGVDNIMIWVENESGWACGCMNSQL